MRPFEMPNAQPECDPELIIGDHPVSVDAIGRGEEFLQRGREDGAGGRAVLVVLDAHVGAATEEGLDYFLVGLHRGVVQGGVAVQLLLKMLCTCIWER